MKQVQKAFVVLSAAIAMDGLAAQSAVAAEPAAEAPKKDKAEKDKTKKKPRVQRVRKARRRPSDLDRDFAMPAGTLYDVISRREI